MRRFSILVLIAAAMCAVVAPPAFAQKPAPKVNPRGACPPNLLDYLLPPDADLMKRSSQISKPGLDLFTASDLFDKVSVKLEFGQKIIVYQTSSSQPPAHFVKLQGREVCGWVKLADVSSVTQPLRLTQLPGTERAKDAKGGESKLLAKVVAMAIRQGDHMMSWRWLRATSFGGNTTPSAR